MCALFGNQNSTKSLGRLFLLSGMLTLASLVTAPAKAGLTLQLLPGLPLVFADTPDRKAMSAKFNLGVEVIKSFESLPIAVAVFYQGTFMSDFGSMALNQNGVSAYYYPFGRPLSHRNIDGMVDVSQRRSSIFAKAGLGLAFFNFRQESSSIRFGASAFSYNIAAGIDQPVSDHITIGAESAYFTTFGGLSTDSTEANPVSVGATGFLFLARIGFVVD